MATPPPINPKPRPSGLPDPLPQHERPDPEPEYEEDEDAILAEPPPTQSNVWDRIDARQHAATARVQAAYDRSLTPASTGRMVPAGRRRATPRAQARRRPDPLDTINDAIASAHARHARNTPPKRRLWRKLLNA